MQKDIWGISRFLVITLLFLSSQAIANIKNKEESATVAVLATRGDLAAQLRWQPTLNWLETQIQGVNFQLKTLSIDELADAVKHDSVDFIITNPGQSANLGKQYRLSWLATLDSLRGGGSSRAIGSTVLVKATSHYTQLADLSGKKIAAVDKNAFGGYQTFVHEIQQQGFDVPSYFSQTFFLGFPIDAILYQLRDGLADAVIVPVCLMEQMQNEGLIAKNIFRVINKKENTNFDCAVSSALFPNWSFARTINSSRILSKKITRALLAMPSDSPAALATNSSGWTPVVSQVSVDKLHQDLDINQVKIRWWTLTMRWVSNNQQWFWVAFSFIVLLNFYHFWLEYRFSKSKKQLAETLNQLKEKNSMLEHAQRVAIVGELGSSLAHEINQPLAAIRNYSQGGLIRLKNGNSRDEIVSVFETIQHQVSRADQIISRLRGLINKRESHKKMCDIEEIISDTLTLLDYDFEKKRISIEREVGKQKELLWADGIGLQQVILNLLSNASDACLQKSKGLQQSKVSIQTHYKNNVFYLIVSDDGIGLQESSEQLQAAFHTTKSKGLGLGLAICRNVIELHDGQLILKNNDAKNSGCKVTVSIPYANSKNKKA